MKLFEASWKEGYDFFERVYDTDLKKSVQRKIHLPSEWYQEQSNGDYSFILDDNIKLVKKQGNYYNKAIKEITKYGHTDPLYRNIKDNYWNKELYNKDANIWYLDIETRSGVVAKGFPEPKKALEEVVLIQVFDSSRQEMYVIGSREWKHQDDYEFDYKVNYIQTANEIELFGAYIKIFQALDPLIIYAWSGSHFDFPYLYNRMTNLGLEPNDLSNYGNIKCEFKEESDGAGTDNKNKSTNGHKSKGYRTTAAGHYYIDLLEVYKKFTFGDQASYSLDYTAELVLGKKKVDHSEYVQFDDFYTGKYVIPKNPTDLQKNSKIYKEAINGNIEEVKELSYSDFVYYGCIDTHLITDIDKARNFTAILMMISEKMGVQLSDATGTVKPWSQYITNRALLNKQVMPPKQYNEEKISIKGGYVREPQVKKHSWILSADVNSMYPLLGMTGFNMSPETFIPKSQLPDDLREMVIRYFNDEDEDRMFEIPEDMFQLTEDMLNKYNYSLGINGAVFSNEKLGMVPEMVQDIYATRKQAKKEMFKYEKQKVLIKSIIDARNAS